MTVNDLHVTFQVRGAKLRAVDGVKPYFEKDARSASSASPARVSPLTARAIMGLCRRSSRCISGLVRLGDNGLVGLTEHQWRQYRGTAISLVFQDPMRSPNPLTLRIGLQITEPLRSHRGLGKKEARDVVTGSASKVRMPSPKQRFYEYPHQLSGGSG